MILGLLAIAKGFYLLNQLKSVGAIIVIGIGFLALVYTYLTFIALFTTKYRLDRKGIDLRFGIWHRFFAWTEVDDFYQQKGFFANKVHLPGASPCVRLNDAVILKMKNGNLIFLTPKNSLQIMEKIAGFVQKKDNL